MARPPKVKLHVESVKWAERFGSVYQASGTGIVAMWDGSSASIGCRPRPDQ